MGTTGNLSKIGEQAFRTRRIDLKEGIGGDGEGEARKRLGKFATRRLAQANAHAIMRRVAKDDTRAWPKSAKGRIAAHLGEGFVDCEPGEGAMGRVKDGLIVLGNITKGSPIPMKREFVAIVMDLRRGDGGGKRKIRQATDAREKRPKLALL